MKDNKQLFPQTTITFNNHIVASNFYNRCHVMGMKCRIRSGTLTTITFNKYYSDLPRIIERYASM